ncbi:MAG: PKD domain-containing protein [Blastococcus sp.]
MSLRGAVARTFWRPLSAALVATVGLSLLVGAGTASAAGLAQSGVVGQVPDANTPQILDGTVHDIAQVGNRIVVSGTFTQIQDAPANGGATDAQPYVFAFDPATGRIDRAFDPQVNGDVRTVEPGPNGTVYIGGVFNSVNGQTGTGVRRLVQLSMATGDRVAAFTTPNISAGVNDLALVGTRLFVGGSFTTVGGVPYGGLVALNPTTGAPTGYLGVDVTLNHNWPDNGGTAQPHAQAPVGVDKFDVTPDGTRMIAIGNFRQADGLPRDQVVMIRLGATSASVDPTWRTRQYEPACYYWAFDSYVRAVQFAPDGSYFAIAASGGGNYGTRCDSLSRFETTATGDDIAPTWTEYTGGDSLFSVAITGSAIYTGGHQRWMNNSLGRDFAGAGAVPRPGISAHDPRTGVPLAWNPGRHPRGVGAEALLATPTGLYVGMDTPYIGNRQYLRPGLAYFPLAGGATAPSEATGTLPANVYLGGPAGAGTGGAPAQVLYRVNAGGPEVAATDGGPAWSADDGADNPLRTSGGQVTDWGAPPALDGTVPAGTPPAVFADERAAIGAPLAGPSQSWTFPVAAGTTVDVRLYMAERDPTIGTGGRLFDVDLEGATRLNFYDLTGDVGHDVGTMKTFRVTSDGAINLDLQTLLGNPIVDAIEIVAPDTTTVPPPGADDVLARWFDGTTAQPDQPAAAGGLQWSKVRGAFMAGNQLIYGYPTADGDYSLFQRSFDGTAFGTATPLDPYDDPLWSDITTGTWWFGVIPNFYRGLAPNFYDQLPSVSSMFFQGGRLYYTREGFTGLYSRGFSVDSGVVGMDQRTQVADGFSDVAGAFLEGGRLYWATRSTGELRSTPWNAGAPNPAVFDVKGGPSVDGRSWATRAMFLGPGGPPAGVNTPPVADIAATCTGLSCTFSGAGSHDPDGTISGYLWNFGDGGTSTQPNPSHTFATAGDHEVALTVTDNQGASTSATRTVSVQTQPGAGIALRGATGVSARAVSSVAVGVPAGVQAGDGLVLVLSTNSTVTGATPAGWTAAGSRLSGTGPNTQVFSRVAGATDAGGTVTVALSGQSKVTLQLMAYSGTAATGPIASVASIARPAGTSHPTPAATAAAGGWVLSVWSDKQNAARTWTAPAAVSVRSNLAGVGGGDVATLVGDSGGPVSGAVGNLTATVPTASTRATTFTIVLAPGGPPAGTVIAARGAAGTAARAVTSVSVAVPANVQAGDGLVLVLSTNSTVTGATPAGWTPAGTRLSGTGPTTQVFQRVAGPGDAGATVTVPLSGSAKVTLQVLAYSGTAATGPVASVTSLATGAVTSHSTPTATAAAGNWVLSVWSDKSTAARTWTPPASGVAVRTNLAGVGSGDVATLVADSGAPVTTTTVGGLTATVPTASTRGTTFTIVLAAG